MTQAEKDRFKNGSQQELLIRDPMHKQGNHAETSRKTRKGRRKPRPRKPKLKLKTENVMR